MKRKLRCVIWFPVLYVQLQFDVLFVVHFQLVLHFVAEIMFILNALFAFLYVALSAEDRAGLVNALKASFLC